MNRLGDTLVHYDRKGYYLRPRGGIGNRKPEKDVMRNDTYCVRTLF